MGLEHSERKTSPSVINPDKQFVMLDVAQHNLKNRSSSLAQWAYQAIAQPGLCLRVRLRGTHLHILCESRQALDAKTVVHRLLHALQDEPGHRALPLDWHSPIDQIIIYSRRVSKADPDWIKQIQLKTSPAQAVRPHQILTHQDWDTPTTHSALLVAHESLARSGSPEAIARYLSTHLSHLAVTVKVQIQDLPAPETHKPLPSLSPYRRLWVICNSNYSPDLLLLAEPLVEQLRSLELKGFRDAVICSQVSGERSPEWMLRVDLTPPEEMLKEFARWGDVQAIARVLNQSLESIGMEVRAILKETTLHLFCRVLGQQDTHVPDQQTAIQAIAPVLAALAPQGLNAATLYGVESTSPILEPDQETPLWIDWLNLPAADNFKLAPSTFALAQAGNPKALTFLLERLINPDLDHRLATGGIQLKIRRKQDLLHIMSEGTLCPPQHQVALPIARFLRQLALPTIAGVRLYGRRTGTTAPEWNYGVDFVPRRRLVPEATPEFTTGDSAMHGLVTPMGETLPEEGETRELDHGLQQITQGMMRLIQRGLCYSQLFVPTLDNQDVAMGAQRSSPVNAQGLTVATIWLIVGLLLTLQTDWLMGHVLRLRAKSQLTPPTAVATQESTVPVSLPHLSLQQETNPEAGDFNASGFTRNGDRSVIMDEGANSTRGSADLSLLALARSLNPSFNNPLLDQKLALYQQRVLHSGAPDVLIVGSSRALRGIDPAALQEALAAQGYEDVDIFNFAVNGATAQVVDLIIRRLLTPDQLPKLVIWADGTRAFNSGREDVTYNAIASSEGYQQLNAGTFPHADAHGASQSPALAQPFAPLRNGYQSLDEWLNESVANLSSTYPQRNQLKSLLREEFVSLLQTTMPSSPSTLDPQEDLTNEEMIDADGFMPLSMRFNPTTYYQNHPKVAGAYDSNYEAFKLDGKQEKALDALLEFAKAHRMTIVFVNLPLSQDYLDPVRLKYEEQFQQHMHATALQRGLIFRDLRDLFLHKPSYFSDPSHLNQYGADEVSNDLAQDPVIPWSLVVDHQ